MNFVAMEPRFYGNSSMHFINMGCLNNMVVTATFKRFLLKIIAYLINKICNYASCMNEPSLNDSKNCDC